MTNRPVNFSDPTGHRACDGGSYECQFTNSSKNSSPPPPEEALKKTITDKYLVNISGAWTLTGLKQLSATLDAYSNAVGGEDQLNYLFQDVTGGVGITFLFDPTNDKNIKAACENTSNPGHACWDHGKNMIEIDAYAFSNDYFQEYFSGGGQTRPKSLGLNNLSSSNQVTIAHEITHALVDANPQSLESYNRISSWRASGATFFYPTSPSEESMATSLAIFVVSGGKDYPGHSDLTSTASTIFQYFSK